VTTIYFYTLIPYLKVPKNTMNYYENNTNFCEGGDDKQMLWERVVFGRPLPAPSPDLRLTVFHSHEFCSILMPVDS
jgi:hypothetical protein